MSRALVLPALLFVSSCTGVRAVQLQPPTPVPPGFVAGYGVEKIEGNLDRARQSAYVKAMDDLLTRSGPVLVSKTLQDSTTVLDLKTPSRTLESTFRLRASRMLHPSFHDSGVDHGYVWVLLATTEEDMSAGWQQFMSWRADRIEQAQKLFQAAKGQERVSLLRASLAMLEDAGAADDPNMLYFEVKAALDAEAARITALEKFQKDFRLLTDTGQLAAAEATLDQARRNGLDAAALQRCTGELAGRREDAMRFIQIGDDLLRDEQYKGAIARYEQARKIDRDNSLVAGKIAMAERFQHEAHARNVRAATAIIVPAATRTLAEYFEYKREEERRKRAAAEKAAEEAKKDSRRR